MWPEIQQVKTDNKRELALTGEVISNRIIKDGGLDKTLFSVTFLNFLNISDTCLEILPDDISNLTNLQSLLLYSNHLTTLPKSIEKLDKLKVLDVSRNQLNNIPAEVLSLPNLVTLNLTSNKLEVFPNAEKAIKLTVLNLSNNSLAKFPDVCHSELNNLSEIHLNGNKIEKIPDSIVSLTALKLLDLSKNSLKLIPKAVASIHKLKDINLKDNPLSDKRLLKLVQQCRTKQIVDYAKQHGSVCLDDITTNKPTKNDKHSANKPESNIVATPVEARGNKIKITRATDDTLKVLYCEEVRTVRPHILCCIVNNINLKDSNLRRFLQAQSKLHDTVCLKREGSTIATHDLNKIKGVLQYTAIEPQRLFITPLGQSAIITGHHLYNRLKLEAETLRKEKKRNVYSGIHRYLYLLDGKEKFACMTHNSENSEEVISVPPLTNSEVTKMTEETTRLLFEVTSSTSAGACRSAMEALIREALLLGLGDPADRADPAYHSIQIQQVRIVDLEGNLRNVYPSRTDLVYAEDTNNIIVERE